MIPATLLHRFRQWRIAKAASVDHPTILADVVENGCLTQRYMFMVVIASGIATIGLLLNSPAVIIGAMLVSPLMGPIALSGISLGRFDLEMGREGFRSLLVGVLLALGMAGLIVLLSPLTDATPEILARTRPNLFDLVVAVLSGLAGGYAIVRDRGGAIVGVAIATALMPPLAVVAYGTVLQQWPIAKGASLLFITNIFAICISMAIVSTWYGFGRAKFQRLLVWQSLVALLVLIPLAIPLSKSLQNIVTETFLSQGARRVVEETAVHSGQSRIQSFAVSFPEALPMHVDVVLLTKQGDPALEENILQRMLQELKKPVTLRLDQIQVADLKKVEPQQSSVANPIQTNTAASALGSVGIIQSVRAFFPIPTRLFEVDEMNHRITILPKSDAQASLRTLHRMEEELLLQHPGWTVQIVPPQQALPKLFYPRGVSELRPDQKQRLADIAWALRAWEAKNVVVNGYASTAGEGPLPLAWERARRVGEFLGNAGFQVRAQGLYPAPKQSARERDFGYIAFQAVEVALEPSAIPTP